MGRSKINISNIEWEIDILEWEISIPDESSELEPASPKPLSQKILEVFGGLKSSFISLCKAVWRIGADDPRRVLHGIKVGIGLVLVSIFYFNGPLYTDFDSLTVWAVMTVVVIFEFTAGATLSKGLNRMFATLMGGMLALAVNRVAQLGVKPVQPFLLGAGVFFISALDTCIRIRPLSARYDYGFLIFVLTFSVITMAGYREDNLLIYAAIRLGTVLIGCAICIVISLLICPIWAGDDLHKLIIRNLEGLAGSLEGCVTEYFNESLDKDSDNDKVSPGYVRVLNSKAREEALANFARWEFPPHGHFRIGYPWQLYVKIGSRIRYCAYCVEALNACLSSEIQESCLLRKHIKAPSMKIVAEASKVLLELADSIKTMTRSTEINLMTYRLNRAVEELQNCLKSQKELFVDRKSGQIVEEATQPKTMNFKVTPPCESENPQVLTIKKADGEANRKPITTSKSKISPHTDAPVTSADSSVPGMLQVQNNQTIQNVAVKDTLSLATVACLLTKIVARVETVIDAVDELGERAHFGTIEDDKPLAKHSPSPLQSIQCPAIVIAAAEQPPERSVKSILAPLQPIQNPTLVTAGADQPPEPPGKSVRWAI